MEKLNCENEENIIDNSCMQKTTDYWVHQKKKIQSSLSFQNLK